MFPEVSPCRTTTTSVNTSSPLGAAIGVGDMARWVAADPASLSLCRRGSRQLPGRSRPAGRTKNLMPTNLMPPALSDAVEG